MHRPSAENTAILTTASIMAPSTERRLSLEGLICRRPQLFPVTGNASDDHHSLVLFVWWPTSGSPRSRSRTHHSWGIYGYWIEPRRNNKCGLLSAVCQSKKPCLLATCSGDLSDMLLQRDHVLRSYSILFLPQMVRTGAVVLDVGIVCPTAGWLGMSISPASPQRPPTSRRYRVGWGRWPFPCC